MNSSIAHSSPRLLWAALGLATGGLSLAAESALEIHELAPRSPATGSTMFTRMDPERTGIVVTNDYADPAMWREHYRELIFGGMGTGVAIGDYDNDGRADVFVVSKTETSRLFRNLGNWRFEDVTESAGLVPEKGWWDQGVSWVRSWFDDTAASGDASGNWEQGAVFVDVNNDGWLDLHVCRFDAPNLLFVNQGDGTFVEEGEARGLAVSDGSGTAAFADYDRDGWLDVYLQTNMLDVATRPDGQPDRLFRNRGDGTFLEVTNTAGIRGNTSGHAAIWWDFDQDDWPDIYVANDFAEPDRMYRNNGDGTFSDVLEEFVPRTPYYAMGADVGDVDNDGDLDFFVADMAASTPERDQRGMAGSRARGQELPVQAERTAQAMRNALYLQTGAGRFQEAAFLAGLAATDWTWSVRWEDLDNDGRVDLHVTNGMIREYHNSDFLEQIMVSENPAEPVRIMKESPVMAEENFAFRNLGNLRFEDVSAAWGLGEKGVSFGAAFGDLDGDGDLDLVYGNYERGPSVLRNDAPTGHRLRVALRGETSNRFGVGATVRVTTAQGEQVRSLLAARGYLSGSEPVLHFGLGEATRIERLQVSWPSGIEQVFTDLSADHLLVIHEAKEDATSAESQQTETPRPWLIAAPDSWGLRQSTREQAGDEELMRPLQPWRFGRAGPDAVVADFDGDGRDDIALGATGAEPARVLFSTQAHGRRVVALPNLSGVAEEGPMLAFDADGDGDVDLLRTHTGARLPASDAGYQPELWLNQGRGEFARSASDVLPRATISVGAAVVTDFDRDGRLDVFLGARMRPGEYPETDRCMWWRRDETGWRDMTENWAPTEASSALVTAAWAGDMDGDGWADLAVATEWGPVRFWKNNRGHGFVDRTTEIGFGSAGTGWWRALAAADLNGDNRPDFVVGNVGLNTQYHASAEEPAVLLAGRFGGRREAVVEAHWVDGRLLPWRNRKDMAAQIRNVARNYRRNADYAQADMAELLGAEDLAAARRWEATELRSGILISDTGGGYRFEPLPRVAQIAPLEDAVLVDLDGDGALDIVAVQNDFSAIALVGRFDGGIGQVLRGDGRGGFAPVSPRQSGLVIPGDAQTVRLIDLDGDGREDVFVTRNDATTLAWVTGTR